MKFILTLLVCLPLSFASAQNLKPYILAFETSESIADVKVLLEKNLSENDIKLVGQYQPANDSSRYVLVFTSSELLDAAEQIGGLSSFAAALRIGITLENEKVVVSYTNPVYWGNAYYRDDFDKVANLYTTLNVRLEKAMVSSGTFVGTSYGSKNGLSIKDLRKYHYMFGMPYFDETVELGEFDNYDEAKKRIESALKEGVPNVTLVYQVSIPNKNISVFGFGLSGEDGEEKFLPIIDKANPKHTAFLPYEVLVIDGEVHMLHGRFRIALSFPDLTMGTFSKIMSTPGDIEKLLEQLVE